VVDGGKSEGRGKAVVVEEEERSVEGRDEG